MIVKMSFIKLNRGVGDGLVAIGWLTCIGLLPLLRRQFLKEGYVDEWIFQGA
jgi:hypothetical protein